jgi:hypothetical protein
MADTYSDGSPRIGGGTFTINSVDYIYENLDISRGTKQSGDEIANGAPGRNYSVITRPTGTATIQLATILTAIPPLHTEFSITEDAAIGAETFFVTQVSKPEKNGEIIKANISFIKKMN